ncbi:hypothetical protein [Nonomuraea antri]|uniref:hypothetical protein n=1 Tax=Nonomuraea antri TaxID=2730852 RepID=UPI001C2B8E67|nr:hypothetical protein [Nonomuraea antri]
MPIKIIGVAGGLVASLLAPLTASATPGHGVGSGAAPSLPRPTGAHPVGTVTLHLVDHSRPDPWVPAEKTRQLMLSGCRWSCCHRDSPSPARP